MCLSVCVMCVGCVLCRGSVGGEGSCGRGERSEVFGYNCEVVGLTLHGIVMMRSNWR